MTAPETVEGVVEELVDEVSTRSPALTIGAFLIGAGVGGGLAFIFTKRKLETKYSQLADDEIAEMREHYQAKGRALEAEAGKTDLSTLIAEKGYISPEPETSSSPPMAVQPPKSVIEDDTAGEPPDDSAMAENAVEGPQGVKAKGEVAVRNIFSDREKAVVPEWDLHAELRRRTPDRPYVIHYDERHEMEEYSEVSYTYYAADDVLCNERDEVIDPAQRDDLVGEANLERFGHGNPDPMIVFIRNDNLEIMYEVIKSPNSFAEEVHGFTHEGWDRRNLERMRRRERDEEI